MSDAFIMTTTFGKRRGWKIHRIRFSDNSILYRITGKDWCRPATNTEIELWKFAKLPWGKNGQR